ncbi:hypothetical protein [Mesorhizobium sp. M0019]|uniref:hypothetical protein n=1 Tax=unclassified Mesorhizobium TaxID=325217 RepID=UPI0033392833
MPNLVKVKLDYSAVGSLLEDLQVGRRDDVKLRIRAGIVSAHVKRADGRVQSATTMLNGQFRQLTDFNPSGLTPAARRRIVKKLRKDGHRQTAIADLIGVSQATVSLDLRK